LLSTRPKDSTPFLPAEDRRFPIRIRTADLTQLLAAENKSPKPPDAADWLPYFLGKQNEAYNWGVDEAFFQNKLKQGGCLVMVDGLDEAPNRHLRERVSRIFEKATMAYAKCDFLVTTRPQSYERDAVLSGFTQLRIRDLELPEIKTFFHHFARALALPDPEAKAFQEILESALAARPEIREMARNPVMLTALAVLQHNSQKLPEYRVELYESILLWLAAARDAAEGRPTAEKCLELLRKLALYMQDAPSGRIVVITKRAAAELAAAQSGGTIEQNEELLERETQDSGIISSIGSDLKFWHLSFQEYLAAREVASLSDEQQVARVVKSPNLFHPEWREMLRLLGGILKQQGVQKVEGLVHAILDTLGDHPTLEKQTRCAALLSAMMRDLKPMGYKPSTEKYEKTVKAVMRIFEPGESEQIDIKTRIEAANLLGQVGDPRLDDDNWVVIPAGTFKMGAKDAESREAPIHEVTLKPLRIGRFPVTVHEYQKFIKQGGYATRKYWSAEGFEKFTEPDDWEDQKRHPNRPVVGVSWYEAAACCAWAGGRLLTEAEWERAARGPQSAQHPWGNQPPLDHSRANYDGVAGGTTPVGLYPAGNSVEGICDLLGNVYEWCSDWYGPYSPGGQDNPAGPPTGEFRAARGGCWYNDSRYVRVSNRFRSGPADRHSDIGFRCARDA
jgi:formylglycine-generating enzyme required for sulfatase activity